MNGRVKSIIVSALMLFSFAVIIVDIVPEVEAPTILEVDDSGGKPYTSIQDAVDDAEPGDIVIVYNGTYYEDVEINKTLNLIGESRDNTIVNGSSSSIWGHNADYINITNFTVENASTGIGLTYSNYSLIENVKAVNNHYGIVISHNNRSIVKNNIATKNANYHGIYLSNSNNITVENNICIDNRGNGIDLYEYCSNNIIKNNLVEKNTDGIHLAYCDNNLIVNNTVINNTKSALKSYGIFIYDSNDNIILNNTLSDNRIGIKCRWNSKNNKIINSTINNSIISDIEVGWNSNLTAINTTFNKINTSFETIDSAIDIRWYLHINVIDYFGSPVPNAKVKIEDNKNGSYNKTYTTDGNGHVRWIQITEYIEQDPDGDTIGNKIYYTPHRIIAWNDTLVGYAYPEPNINESKTITIVLYNGTLLDLKTGWNLISLPRAQSDTNLNTVLQSIEGYYDTAWWYNITDHNDHWKLFNIFKPSFMNDLWELNHTIGFWLHITDTQGTTLVVFGNKLTSEQNITIYPGWNLVGFPSKANKTRDVGLGTLNFGSDIDSIWTYNSSSQKWKEIGPSDYFEVGKGYWVHSKVKKIWNVPL